MHVLSNFFFCHYVFKKPSAAEASESVYMREKVKSETRLVIWNLSLLLGLTSFKAINCSVKLGAILQAIYQEIHLVKTYR